MMRYLLMVACAAVTFGCRADGDEVASARGISNVPVCVIPPDEACQTIAVKMDGQWMYRCRCVPVRNLAGR